MDPQVVLGVLAEILHQLSTTPHLPLVLIALVGFWAGIQNAMAGGGSFITLPALIASGLTPLEANITSTVALFPGQVVSGAMGWRQLGENRPRMLLTLACISLLGGALGGCLLIGTPPRVFSLLLPWLVLFATLVFVWGNFRKKSPHAPTHHKARTLIISQFLISIYGGYFGGGIGFLMLAALTIAGFSARVAGNIKNVFAAAMNLSAVLVFATSPGLHWIQALTLGTGGLLGFTLGSHLLGYINEKWLRAFVILVGFSLTIWLFTKDF